MQLKLRIINVRNGVMDFLGDLKVYGYWIYLAIAGYMGWNHKRIDNVIKESAVTRQDVTNLKDTVDHIRNGVDKLTERLIDQTKK
jgi:hypothetical protein